VDKRKKFKHSPPGPPPPPTAAGHRQPLQRLPLDVLPATLPLPTRIHWIELAANNFNRMPRPLKILSQLANSSSRTPYAALADLHLAGNLLLIGRIPSGVAQCRAVVLIFPEAAAALPHSASGALHDFQVVVARAAAMAPSMMVLVPATALQHAAAEPLVLGGLKQQQADEELEAEPPASGGQQQQADEELEAEPPASG
jgi:hypothetical protein